MMNQRRFIKSEKAYRIKYAPRSMEAIFDAFKANTGKTYLYIESAMVPSLSCDSKDCISVLARPKDTQVDSTYDTRITLEQGHDELVISIAVLIKEPLLPKVPRSKKNLTPPEFSLGIFILGFIMFVIPSLLYYFWYKRKVKKHERISALNYQANNEVVQWKEAWRKWEDSTLEDAFLPGTEDKLALFEKELLDVILHALNIPETLVSLIESRESTKQQIEIQVEARKYNCLYKKLTNVDDKRFTG